MFKDKYFLNTRISKNALFFKTFFSILKNKLCVLIWVIMYLEKETNNKTLSKLQNRKHLASPPRVSQPHLIIRIPGANKAQLRLNNPARANFVCCSSTYEKTIFAPLRELRERERENSPFPSSPAPPLSWIYEIRIMKSPISRNSRERDHVGTHRRTCKSKVQIKKKKKS